MGLILNKLFKSKAKKQKLVFLLSILCGLTGLLFLILSSFNDALVFYHTPSEVYKYQKENQRFRLGGRVKEGSLISDPYLKHQFILEDETHQILVSYEGLLPELFKEGQYAIAEGYYESGKGFLAEEVLAKHDETYRPQEIKQQSKLESKAL